MQVVVGYYKFRHLIKGLCPFIWITVSHLLAPLCHTIKVGIREPFLSGWRDSEVIVLVRTGVQSGAHPLNPRAALPRLPLRVSTEPDLNSEIPAYQLSF